MRYLGMPAGMWVLFAGSFREKLTGVLGYGRQAARVITRQAQAKYSKRATVSP